MRRILILRLEWNSLFTRQTLRPGGGRCGRNPEAGASYRPNPKRQIGGLLTAPPNSITRTAQ
jgi:hypothetical protein